MADAAKTPNVVEACCKPGLYKQLEDLQARYIFSSRTSLKEFGGFKSAVPIVTLLVRVNSTCVSRINDRIIVRFDGVSG